MKQIQDERTLQAKNQIYSELMRILLYLVIISFYVKSLYFHMDLKQCLTEYIIMIFAPLYQMVRTRQMGVVLGTGRDSRRRALPLLLAVLLIGTLIYLGNAQASAEARGSSALLTMAIYLALFLVLQHIFSRMEEKRAKKLEDSFDEEENS
ncbi:DUF6773 family protein [Anaerotignum sp.]